MDAGSTFQTHRSSVRATDDALFAVRIGNVDSYRALPLEKRGGILHSTERYIQHPVIRIFGSTPAGQRCCVHVHGAFPYLYVLVDDAKSALANPAAYVKALESSLERELRPEAGAAPRPTEPAGDGAAGAPAAGAQAESDAGAAGAGVEPSRPRGAKSVRSVQLVRAVPYYGYRYAGPGADPSVGSSEAAWDTNGTAANRHGVTEVKYPERSAGHLFARVVLYSPSSVKRATEVLQSGSMTGFPPFQPYEAHVPFLLQFFIDYNLSGMALLAGKDVRFRLPLPVHPPRKPLRPETLQTRVGLRRPGTLHGGASTGAGANVSLTYETDHEGSAASGAAGPAPSVSQPGLLSPVGTDRGPGVMSRVWLAGNTPQGLTHGAAPALEAHAALLAALASGFGEGSGDAVARPVRQDLPSEVGAGGGASGLGHGHGTGGSGAGGSASGTGQAPATATFAGLDMARLFGQQPGAGPPGAGTGPGPPAGQGGQQGWAGNRGRDRQDGYSGPWGRQGPGPAATPAPSAPAAALPPPAAPVTVEPPAWLSLRRHGIYRPDDLHGYGRDTQGNGILTRESTVELEVDVWVEDILNPIEREALRARARARGTHRRASLARSSQGGVWSRDAHGTQLQLLASSADSTDGHGTDDLPFGSVFSLAYLWEEERARCAAHGAAPPKSSVAGLSATQLTATQASPGAGAGASSGTRPDPASLLSARIAASGGLPDMDAELEQQLDALARADRHALQTQARGKAGQSLMEEQAKLAAAISAFPPAHEVSYGSEAEAVKLEPMVGRRWRSTGARARAGAGAGAVVAAGALAGAGQGPNLPPVAASVAAPQGAAGPHPDPAALFGRSSASTAETGGGASALEWLAGQSGPSQQPSQGGPVQASPLVQESSMLLAPASVGGSLRQSNGHEAAGALDWLADQSIAGPSVAPSPPEPAPEPAWGSSSQLSIDGPMDDGPREHGPPVHGSHADQARYGQAVSEDEVEVLTQPLSQKAPGDGTDASGQAAVAQPAVPEAALGHAAQLANARGIEAPSRAPSRHSHGSRDGSGASSGHTTPSHSEDEDDGGSPARPQPRRVSFARHAAAGSPPTHSRAGAAGHGHDLHLPSPFSIVKLARRVSVGARDGAGQPSLGQDLQCQDGHAASQGAGAGSSTVEPARRRRSSHGTSSRRAAMEWRDIVASQLDARAEEPGQELEHLGDDEDDQDEQPLAKHARLADGVAAAGHAAGSTAPFDEVDEFARLTQASHEGGPGAKAAAMAAGPASSGQPKVRFASSASLLQLPPPSSVEGQEDLQLHVLSPVHPTSASVAAASAIRQSHSERRALAWNALQLSLSAIDQDQDGDLEAEQLSQPRLVALAAEAAGVRCDTPPPTQAVVDAQELREDGDDGAADMDVEEGGAVEDEAQLGGVGHQYRHLDVTAAAAVADDLQMALSQHDAGAAGLIDDGVPSASPGVGADSVVAGSGSAWYRYTWQPPTSTAVHESFHLYGLHEAVETVPHYGRDSDVPERPRVMAGMVFRIPGTGLGYLAPFDTYRACLLYHRRQALERAVGQAMAGGARTATAAGAGASSSSTRAPKPTAASLLSSDPSILKDILHEVSSQEVGSANGMGPSSFSITRAGAQAGRRAQATAGSGPVAEPGHVDTSGPDHVAQDGDELLEDGQDHDEDQDEDDEQDEDGAGGGMGPAHAGAGASAAAGAASSGYSAAARMPTGAGWDEAGPGEDDVEAGHASPQRIATTDEPQVSWAQRHGSSRGMASLADHLRSVAQGARPPYPPIRPVSDYASSARGLLKAPGHGAGPASPTSAQHAFLPESLPPMNGAAGAGSSSSGFGRPASGPVLLRRFVCGQPGVMDLPGLDRGACIRAGHTVPTATGAPRVLCTRMWVQWGAPFPSRRTVAKWTKRNPVTSEFDREQDLLWGPDDAGTQQHDGPTKAVADKVPERPQFDANTGRLLPTADRAAGHGLAAGGAEGMAVSQDGASQDLTADTPGAAASGQLGSATSAGAEVGHTPATDVHVLADLSRDDSMHSGPGTGRDSTGGGTGPRDATVTGDTNTTMGTRTPSTVRAMHQAVVDRGVHSQLSPAPGVKRLGKRDSAGQVVGFKNANVPQDEVKQKGGQAAGSTSAAADSNAAGAAAQPAPAPPTQASTTATQAPADVNQHMTILSLELAVRTRDSLLPDPRQDAIVALCYSILDDDLVEAGRAQAAAQGHEFKVESAMVVGAIIVDKHAPALAYTADGIEPAALLRWFDDGASVRLASSYGTGKRLLTLSVPDETSLMWALVALVRAWDPDILTGWEVQQGSWGYLFDRATALGISLAAHISRTPGAGVDRRHNEDDWGETHGSGLWITGRTVLNGWRILKGEIKLNIYTLENCAWAVLRQRVPHFPHQVLTRWWDGQGPPRPGQAPNWHPYGLILSPSLTRCRVLDYWASRACLTLAMMDHLDIVGRTSETARLFGIDFYSVLSRGSQYRVEAVMIRVSKPLGYLAPSASRKQVAQQAAMEVQPLILEPQSRLYTGPVIVLDFQSLYPSIVIAYNMCYSTCLGRLTRPAGKGSGAASGGGAGAGAGSSAGAGASSSSSSAAGPRAWQADSSGLVYSKLGFLDYSPPSGSVSDFWRGPGHATQVRSGDRLAGAHAPEAYDRPHRPESVYVAPNGAMFAPWKARQGILPRMLNEILDTRVMVKDSAKRAWAKGDPVLQRVLHARQFALKMIANVTYGYTAAGFSGRMPCAEIADAIVSAGRETLDRAIRLVEGNPKWRARVCYGDTDSMFVHVPGRSWREAWAIGEEIADAVTARNPRPIQLKLDKVYSRAVLVAKKRYAGWMYDRKDAKDEDGVLDVKGLEVVRRDSCGVVQNTMEAVLRQLFTGDVDLSSLKGYLTRQWTRMHEGRIPLSEFTFAKEVFMGLYSNRGPPPPHAIVASKAMMADPRAEPRQGERVRYVVVYGPRGVPLVDLVLSPHQVLAAPGRYRLHVGYYIEKHVIPSLGRIASLFGVDLREWYGDMRRPNPRRYRLPEGAGTGQQGQGQGQVGLAVVPAAHQGRYAAHLAKLRRLFAGTGIGFAGAGHHDAMGRAGPAEVVDLTSTPEDGAGTGAGGGGGGPASGAAGAGAGASSSAGPTVTTGAHAAATGQAAAPVPSGWAQYGPYGMKRRRGAVGPGTGTRTLDAFYATADCELCGSPAPSILCDSCMADPQKAAYILLQRRRVVEESAHKMLALCAACTGIGDTTTAGASACDSLDCPVLFQRLGLANELTHFNTILRELGLLD